MDECVDNGLTIMDILPRELILQIFSLLPYRDLLSVGRTCKQLHDLSKDDVLLQKIVQTEYRDDNHWSYSYSSYTHEQMSRAVFLGNIYVIET